MATSYSSFIRKFPKNPTPQPERVEPVEAAPGQPRPEPEGSEKPAASNPAQAKGDLQ